MTITTIPKSEGEQDMGASQATGPAGCAPSRDASRPDGASPSRMTMLGALVVGHALADYPLQGDFLAKAKDRTAPIPGVPWWQALGAHAIIHGGVVAAITKRPALGVAEAVVHAITDDLKCRGKLTFNQDQAIHAGCKILWALLAKPEKTHAR